MAAPKRSRGALRAALEALDGMAARRPLGAALADALARGEKLGPAERRAAAALARGTTRELRRVDLCLVRAFDALGQKGTVTAEDRSLLRAVAFLVAVEGEAPAEVLPAFRLPGPRRPRAIDDALLGKLAAALPRADELPAPGEPARAVAQRRSVPDHLVHALAADRSLEEVDALLAALNRDARLDLRANRLLATRDEVLGKLVAAGVAARPAALAPDGIVADDRKGVFGKLHDEGLFEVQDEGSQLLAALCAARPGETAVDLCAGSGGKSLALAAEVGPTGKVVACDAVPRRLAELPRRARRARAARIVEVAGAAPPPSLEGKADVVLVDAPCSGIGGLRREPDLRWRLDPKELAALPAKQLAILAGAARWVRPGGRLVYGTCSPLRAEDDAVVESFLSKDPRFTLGDAAAALPASARPAVDARGLLRVAPERFDTGAYFGALLVRSA